MTVKCLHVPLVKYCSHCILVNFNAFLSLLTFFKINFVQEILSETLTNCQTVGIQMVLDPNCLQMLSADGKSNRGHGRV